MIIDCFVADVGARVGVVGASVEAGVGGDVSTDVGIGVSVHTPLRNEQGPSSSQEFQHWLAKLVNCSPQTVSDSWRSVHCFPSSSQARFFQ